MSKYPVHAKLNLSPKRQDYYRRLLCPRYNMPLDAAWSRIIAAALRDLSGLLEAQKENPQP